MTPREELAARRALAAQQAASAPPPSPAAAIPARPGGSFPGLWGPMMQGLTLGAADELGDLGVTLRRFFSGQPWEQARAAGARERGRQREDLAAVREEMPIASMGAEAAGALGTGAPLARGLMAGAQALRAGPVAAPIMTGGAEGGLAGFMAADENRLAGAGLGAGLGAGGTAAMGPIGAGAGKAWEAALPYTRKLFEGPRSAAGRIMTEQLQATGMTPAMLRARQRQLGPEAAFADVAGDAGIGLGQGVVQADKTGAVAAEARKRMRLRDQGSTERLRRDMAGVTGVSERLQPSLDAVRARQVAASEPAYATAYAQDINLTPKLKNLLERPPMRKAWAEARDAAATRGEELPPFMQLDEFGNWEQQGVMPDMRSWDRMKQGLDRLIDAQTDPVTGRVTPRGRDLVKMKGELTEELDAINPAYKRARQAFAGDAEIESAMRQGEKFLTMKTREVKSALEGATDSEREAFLVGATEAMRERMGRAKSGDIGEFRFLETTNVKEKLRDLFPKGREGDKALAELLRTLERERTFASTQGGLVGGSQTALRQAAREAVEGGGLSGSPAEFLANPMGASVAALTSRASEALGRTSPRAIREMGGMLVDPAQVGRAIREFEGRYELPTDIMQDIGRNMRYGVPFAPLFGLGAGNYINE